jgi:hypothetical protein
MSRSSAFDFSKQKGKTSTGAHVETAMKQDIRSDELSYTANNNASHLLKNQLNNTFEIRGKPSNPFKHGFIYDTTTSDECDERNLSRTIALSREEDARKDFPPSPMVTPPPRDRHDSVKSLDESIMSYELKPVAQLPLGTSFRGTPHIYHDYGNTPDIDGFVRKKTGGVSQPFPEKMHEMLSSVDNDEMEKSIVSWLPHGRAFIVRIPIQFTKMIMPK